MSKNIYQKLLAIQNELNCPKNQFNKFGGYAYRSQEDILNAVKPLLVKYNATIIMQDKTELIGDRYYIRVVAKFIDVETGETIETEAVAREQENIKGMQASQITGATSSYARKYCLNALLLIDDCKDADSTNNHGKEENKTPPKEDKPTFAGPASEKVNVKNIWTKGTTNQEEDKVISFNQSSQDLITKSEMMFIYSRGFQAGYSQDQVKNHIIKKFNKTIDQLTKVEATKIVEGYQSKILKKMEG